MVKQLSRFATKKTKTTIVNGVAHIKATFNNTIINLTDNQGNTLFWSSAGGTGFVGSKKGTPYAAQSTAEKVATVAYERGMRQVKIVVNGPGSGRESAIRALRNCGLQISIIQDITPVPHNGCRPPKRRRV